MYHTPIIFTKYIEHTLTKTRSTREYGCMKLLEFEAKAMLRDSGVSVPHGTVVITDDIATPAVLKSQVPTGGRGKLGGVRIVRQSSDLQKTVAELLELDIKGYRPHYILAEELLDVDRELYLSLTINRQTASIELIASPNGGIEVEANDSRQFRRFDLSRQPIDAVAQTLADELGLNSQVFLLADFLEKLLDCFRSNDCSLLEINPLVITTAGNLVAGDCKMTVDDSSLFRHQDWNFNDTPVDTNFVLLNPGGDIATIANGAGLAMATVDAVEARGYSAANFLDIGGSATEDNIIASLKKIHLQTRAKAIIVNIFAGIVHADDVARACLHAQQTISGLAPLYIRLSGTNSNQAIQLLSAAGVRSFDNLDACLTAVRKEIT